jgi:hypothetical protein
MDVYLLWAVCFVRKRTLRRADHSSRGVLPTVVCRCVWSRNLVNEEALAHWGLSLQKQTNKDLVTAKSGAVTRFRPAPFGDRSNSFCSSGFRSQISQRAVVWFL